MHRIPFLTAVAVALIVSLNLAASGQDQLLAPKAPAAPIAATDQPSATEVKALKAYQDVKTYAATIDLTVTQKHARWTQTLTTSYNVAFDRAGGRLMIDRPMLSGPPALPLALKVKVQSKGGGPDTVSAALPKVAPLTPTSAVPRHSVPLPS